MKFRAGKNTVIKLGGELKSQPLGSACLHELPFPEPLLPDVHLGSDMTQGQVQGRIVHSHCSCRQLYEHWFSGRERKK